MESDMELEKAKNEVLSKIGRNMLLFQQLEQMLKYLIANGKVAGCASEIKANKEKRAAAINKQTLGVLVGDFLENTISNGEEIPEVPLELKEPFISIGFKLEIDENDYERKKQALAEIVKDRNELIHNFLPRFDPNSIESCLETENHLDQQREKLLPEINGLMSLIKSLQKGRKEITDFLKSDEGKKCFFSPRCGGNIIYYLGQIAAQVVRPDGWTPLSIAGQIIWKQKPEEITDVYQKYGHKTLKGLILATELFEIKEEPTKKGGIQVLYRLKPGWTFE